MPEKRFGILLIFLMLFILAQAISCKRLCKKRLRGLKTHIKRERNLKPFKINEVISTTNPSISKYILQTIGELSYLTTEDSLARNYETETQAFNEASNLLDGRFNRDIESQYNREYAEETNLETKDSTIYLRGREIREKVVDEQKSENVSLRKNPDIPEKELNATDIKHLSAADSEINNSKTHTEKNSMKLNIANSLTSIRDESRKTDQSTKYLTELNGANSQTSLPHGRQETPKLEKNFIKPKETNYSASNQNKNQEAPRFENNSMQLNVENTSASIPNENQETPKFAKKIMELKENDSLIPNRNGSQERTQSEKNSMKLNLTNMLTSIPNKSRKTPKLEYNFMKLKEKNSIVSNQNKSQGRSRFEKAPTKQNAPNILSSILNEYQETPHQLEENVTELNVANWPILIKKEYLPTPQTENYLTDLNVKKSFISVTNESLNTNKDTFFTEHNEFDTVSNSYSLVTQYSQEKNVSEHELLEDSIDKLIAKPKSKENGGHFRKHIAVAVSVLVLFALFCYCVYRVVVGIRKDRSGLHSEDEAEDLLLRKKKLIRKDILNEFMQVQIGKDEATQDSMESNGSQSQQEKPE